MIEKKFNDEKGVTHVIEFTIALTVFVLILQAFTSAMNFRIGIDLDNNDNRIVMAREVVSELTGSMGNFRNITNWDTLEFGIGETQLKDGGIVGLLNSNGELDSKKCKALGKFPYPNLKNELGVTEQLRIEIRTLVPDEVVCLWGGDLNTVSMSTSSERFILYNNSSETLPAVLTVTVYDGKSPTNYLYLSELMYSPTNQSSNYQWVEVYNPNNFATYISSWLISDSEENDQIIPEEGETITIPSQKAGILTSSPNLFKDTHGNYTYVFSVEDTAIGNGLGNNDTVTLTKGTFKDIFSYNKSYGADGNGKTLTRSCYNCETWNEAVASPGTI